LGLAGLETLDDPVMLLIHEVLDPGLRSPLPQGVAVVDLLPGGDGPGPEDQGQDERILPAQILGLDVIFDAVVADVAVQARNHEGCTRMCAVPYQTPPVAASEFLFALAAFRGGGIVFVFLPV